MRLPWPAGPHGLILLRAAMHAGQEQVHVAQWPSVIDLHQVASRHYAFEGSCFVLACGTVLTKKDVMEGFDSLEVNEPEAYRMLDRMASGKGHYLMIGGSCVVQPDARFLTRPVLQEEIIVYAELDFNLIIESNLVMDTNGHYSRPDIFSLSWIPLPSPMSGFTGTGSHI